MSQRIEVDVCGDSEQFARYMIERQQRIQARLRKQRRIVRLGRLTIIWKRSR